MKRKKPRRTKRGDSEEEGSDSDTEGITTKAVKIGRTQMGRKWYYEFDTAATHHTTNMLGWLEDILGNQETRVGGYQEGTESICTTIGTLVLRHNRHTLTRVLMTSLSFHFRPFLYDVALSYILQPLLPFTQ